LCTGTVHGRCEYFYRIRGIQITKVDGKLINLLLLQVVVDDLAVAVGQALQRGGGEPGVGGVTGPQHSSLLFLQNGLADFLPCHSFGGFSA